jgi:hypothetical protein
METRNHFKKTGRYLKSLMSRKIKFKKMEKSKVDMFIGMNVENFNPQDLMMIKEKLEKMEDDKFFMLQGAEFQKPSTIFLIAILLGWERFWLDDVGLGILKIVTCYGCFIWWLADIISAKERAKKYNFKKFTQVSSFM